VRWFATGRTSVSLCRCETEAILWDPVAMRRAVFWMVCSLAMDEGEEFGNQMGAAYVAMEWMRDLYVIIIVSLCWPHEVPARDLRMLSLLRALSHTECM